MNYDFFLTITIWCITTREPHIVTCFWLAQPCSGSGHWLTAFKQGKSSAQNLLLGHCAKSHMGDYFAADGASQLLCDLLDQEKV